MEKLVLKRGDYIKVKNEAHLRYIFSVVEVGGLNFYQGCIYPLYLSILGKSVFHSHFLPTYCTNEIFVDPLFTIEKLVLKHGDYITIKNESHFRYVSSVFTVIGANIYQRSIYPFYLATEYRKIFYTHRLPVYCTNEIFVDPPLTVENETPSAGTKHDNKKPRYDLIPPFAEKQVVDVLTFGAEKYGAENWRDVDNYETRYIAAAMRHIAAYRSGEKIDNESGVNHLAHAVCSLMFIIDKDAK